MKRIAAAMMFAVAVTGCSTPARRGKPPVYRVEEIRQEYDRLSGSYHFTGLVQTVGAPGRLALHRDGSYRFTHAHCTNIVKAISGSWHPFADRIEFEPETTSAWSEDWLPPFSVRMISTDPIEKADLVGVEWQLSGLKIIANSNAIFLYPLDPALRREIVEGLSQWPLKKDVRRRKGPSETKRKR